MSSSGLRSIEIETQAKGHCFCVLKLCSAVETFWRIIHGDRVLSIANDIATAPIQQSWYLSPLYISLSLFARLKHNIHSIQP